ncbi:hypothetical protein BH09ACT5_BH09ACT5_09380 [soil metagenome]
MDTIPSTISDQVTLEGTTTGNVTVVDGGSLVIAGTHDGTVELEGGATLSVPGVLKGTLAVGSLANATVTGDVVGQVMVRVAGTLVNEVGGRIAGPVTNHGSFTNRGLRSGPVEGREPLDESGAVKAEPVHPGVYNYVLPERS